jgi:hypothetical protein
MDVKTTATPDQMVKPYREKWFDPEDVIWSQMGIAIYQGIVDSLSDRSDFDQLLDYYNDLYEMNVSPKMEPWPNAPSICVPLVATQTEAVVARLASSVFVPRLFVVNGNTTQSAGTQNEVERYYNADFKKFKMLQTFLTGLHLSARDGTTIMENVWKKKVVERKVLIYQDVLENGVPVPDGKGGFVKEKSVEKMTITEVDHFDPQNVELRDFVVMPAYSVSIEAAEAVARKQMLTQSDLQEMIDAGTLDQEWTEKAWSYITQGDNEMSSDPQGTATYELGGTINVGNAGTMDPAGPGEKGGKLRGALRVWRVHSNQFDLDGDGLAEENVFWIHDDSQYLLGWAPYEYWHGKRPFSALCLMPRPNRFYGFGIPERLRSLQEEVNAQHNQRLAYMDLILSPPRYRVAGTKFEDQDQRWGPNTEVEVGAQGDYGFVALPEVPASSWNEEGTLMNYAGQLTGINSPSAPMSGSGKGPSQKMQQLYQQSANLRLDLMALQVRQWIEDILWQWHHLNLQYGPDQFVTSSTNQQGQPEKLTIDKEILAGDYDLAVAGMSGPLDRDNRRADTLTLYSLLMQNPLVQGNMSRVWSSTMMVLEEFNRPDVPAIIGTMQDALQQQQQQQQAAQQQAQMQMKMAEVEHGNTTDQLKAEQEERQHDKEMQQREAEADKQKHAQEMQKMQAQAQNPMLQMLDGGASGATESQPS